MESNKSGRAHGFFKCRSGEKRIASFLPTIREFAQVPLIVETILAPLAFNAGKDDVPASSVRSLGCKRKYSFILDYPGKSNEEAAGELAAIFNQMYNSPLFKDGEKFFGEIFYLEGGKYHSFSD